MKLKPKEERQYNKKIALDYFFEKFTHPIALKKASGEYIKVNKEFLKTFSKSEKDILGKIDDEIFPKSISTKMISGDKECLDKKKITKYYRNLNKLGQVHRIKKVSFSDNQGNIFISVLLQNVTDELFSKKKLIKEINIDNLTGLYTKKYLRQKINKYIKSNTSFSILQINFDKFQLINDSLGHNIGDKVLKKVSSHLKKFLKEKHTIARLGGDSFAVLIKDEKNTDNLTKLSKKIIASLAKPFVILNNEIFMSASIGVVTSDIQSESGTEYLRDVEIALIRAKKLGRGKYKIFDKKMHISLLRQWNLESELQKAYRNNDFEIFYQPIFNLETNLISSFETLIRWNHPRFGYISPEKFLTAANDIGIINPIDRWVIKESLQKILELSNKFNLELNVSVNLSPIQFSKNSLLPFIKETLAETGFEPKLLHLEITENTFLTDLKNSLRVMYSLKDLGVNLTLDDFGTGYASLSYLKKLPIDTLKIDKSFIQGISKQNDDRALVEMLVNLTKILHLHIIAEGVESKDQYEILKNFGCNYIQGYLISKPIRGDNLEFFLANIYKAND
jgi:diguanylate cyclase